MTPTPSQLVAVRDAALDAHAMTRERGWLQAFVRRAWPIIGDRDLEWNWHLSLMCEELEGFASGRTREEYFGLYP